MHKLLLLLFLPLAFCQNFIPTGISQSEQDSLVKAGNELRNTFNNPKCSNPCWLDIELDKTDKATATTILQDHNVKFTLEGYDGAVVWLHHIPGGLFPHIASQRFAEGSINFGASDGNLISSMNFDLDICVSTVISAYGVPDVWFTESGIPSTIVYLQYQLFFGIDTTTWRIDSVFLHLEDAMPSPEDLQPWSNYANVFAGNCSDIFTQYSGQ